MISIKNYEKPTSTKEAYNLLTANKKATLIGGGAFLKLGSKNISTAVDLSNAGLDYVLETESYVELGGMTPFHQLEIHPILKNFQNNILGIAVKEIVGIQLRNIVTVGATVYSRYGFSDLITALLALETEVKLYDQGFMPLNEFLEKGSKKQDILEFVRIKKTDGASSFKSMRKSKADYAVLNLAVSKTNQGIRIAVGARPNRSILALETMAFLNQQELNETSIEEACKILENELIFGTNMRATKEYRKMIVSVLFKRALMEVLENEN